MNEESLLLATVWDTLSGYISASDKQEAAGNLVEALVELGYDLKDLHDAEGECTHLDRALEAAGQNDEDDHDEDFVEMRD